MKNAVLILLVLISSMAYMPKVEAQCSMCTINAEQSTKNGNTQGNGLNTGILYLLVIPYLLATTVGIIWYKNYRKKIIATNQPFQTN